MRTCFRLVEPRRHPRLHAAERTRRQQQRLFKHGSVHQAMPHPVRRCRSRCCRCPQEAQYVCGQPIGVLVPEGLHRRGHVPEPDRRAREVHVAIFQRLCCRPRRSSRFLREGSVAVRPTQDRRRRTPIQRGRSTEAARESRMVFSWVLLSVCFHTTKIHHRTAWRNIRILGKFNYFTGSAQSLPGC